MKGLNHTYTCIHSPNSSPIQAATILSRVPFAVIHLKYLLRLLNHSVLSDSLDPMDCSTPGFPVLHHLLELAQTHVRGVNDAIQPSHPLSSPFPPALNLSQHQGLFQ